MCEAGARLQSIPNEHRYQVECEDCGNFEISDEVMHEVQQKDRYPSDQRRRLSKAIRLVSGRGEAVHLRNMSDVMYIMAELAKSEQQRPAKRGE